MNIIVVYAFCYENGHEKLNFDFLKTIFIVRISCDGVPT